MPLPTSRALSASEVLRIAPSEIEAPQNVFPDEDMNYVTGVGKLKDRLIILLDLNRILQRTEMQRIKEVAEFAGAPVEAGVSRLR